MNNALQHLFPSSRYQQRGLTLVEILVALMISLFLMAGVIQLFIGSKQTYRFHDGLSRIQENGRFAVEALSRDIRAASYYPKVTTVTTTTTGTPSVTTTETITTLRPTWPSQPPTNQPMSIIGDNDGSNDGITVQWLAEDAVTVNSRRYSVGARPVGSTVPTCPGAATSLLVDRFDGAGPQELIEGVEAMQIFYGEDTTAKIGTCDNPNSTDIPCVASQYVLAGAVGNWNNVVSVRIHLLLVSLEDNLVTASQTVLFPAETGTVFPVNDLCLRQAFSTTVAIRNRID